MTISHRLRMSLKALVMVTALVVIGFADIASGSKSDPVRIALDDSATSQFIGIYVAIDHGFFADQDIQPEIIPYANESAETLIRANETDLGISDPSHVIVNRSRGLAYKAVAALSAEDSHSVNAVYVAGDREISKRADVLRRVLAALAEGYKWSVAHPAAAEKILLNDNPTALREGGRLVDASGRPGFLNESGQWGRLANSDFTSLEATLAGSGAITTVPAPGDLYTNALLP